MKTGFRDSFLLQNLKNSSRPGHVVIIIYTKALEILNSIYALGLLVAAIDELSSRTVAKAISSH